MASTGPTVWVVHDGKIGMANQVIGLAEAVGFPFAEKRLDIRAPWRHLAPQLWLRPLAALGPAGDRLQPPWPDLLIASGGRVFWVQVQDPRFARREVDLMVVPEHDPARGDNVFPTMGAVHRVTAARLADGARRFGPQLAG